MEKFTLPASDRADVVRYLKSLEKSARHATDDGHAGKLIPAETVLGKITGARVLKGFRSRDELTQAELAKKIGTSQTAIAAMENGSRPIGKETAKKLARIFKTDYRIFL